MTTAVTGRIFDDRAKRRYVKLLSRGVARPLAAEKVGFAYSTVKRHLKDDPAFALACDDAYDDLLDTVESVPVQKALDGNLMAAIFLLTNKRPEKWRDMKTVKTEITGAGGGPIQIVQATTIALREVLSDDDTRRAALAMVRSIPVAGQPALPVGNDGFPAALPGRVVAEHRGPDVGPEASEAPE